MRLWELILAISFWVLLASIGASAKNLHLIEQAPNGFAIYRYGQPSEKDMKEMHQMGISEVMILSGDGAKKGNEGPSSMFKVFYNEKQSGSVPVTKEFLKKFDEWVADAKANGKKIAFRCECGCHRTGRLAAYYQMKNQKITSDDAIAIMNKHGSMMFLHKNLYPQVRAMEEFIQGKPCTQGKYCLRE